MLELVSVVAAVASAFAAIAALVLALNQHRAAQAAEREALRRHEEATEEELRRQRADDDRKAAEAQRQQLSVNLQRHGDLTEWGAKVIGMMAELEAYCWPAAPSAQFDARYAESLSWQASALVDEGRLFFPKVTIPTSGKGYRVKVLDEVLRAFYVARHLAENGRTDGEAMRKHVWRARTEFVALLQHQVRDTLIAVGEGDAGVSIPKDPRTWQTRTP